MAEPEKNPQSDFMMEKIKERPVNKKKLLRRTVTTVAMAVIFGMIACVTFLTLEPVISNLLYPEEKPDAVIFPEEQEEISPEDMLVEDAPTPSIQEAVESVILEDEQIQKILDEIVLDKNNYAQLYNALYEYSTILSEYMVEVTAVSSNEDWLSDTYEKEGKTYGVVIANNGREYLILTDRNTVKQAGIIRVTFHDGVQVKAERKQSDVQTNLTVLSVSMDDIPDEKKDDIKMATLGSSNFRQAAGTPVVAMGSPLGISGSMGYGMIASSGITLSKVDANYKIFATDITGSASGIGVLFNLQGQIVGIITTDRYSPDSKNMISAIGISELRKLIENMSNGKDAVYVGISGIDVTTEAHEEMEVPFGAYVRETAMESPAMLAGVQKGDVIVEINGEAVTKFSDYTAILLRSMPGDTLKVKFMRSAQGEYREMETEITVNAAKK